VRHVGGERHEQAGLGLDDHGRVVEEQVEGAALEAAGAGAAAVQEDDHRDLTPGGVGPALDDASVAMPPVETAIAVAQDAGPFALGERSGEECLDRRALRFEAALDLGDQVVVDGDVCRPADVRLGLDGRGENVGGFFRARIHGTADPGA
jgi:hypothetical protein